MNSLYSSTILENLEDTLYQASFALQFAWQLPLNTKIQELIV
jgi:hypothetical protein